MILKVLKMDGLGVLENFWQSRQSPALSIFLILPNVTPRQFDPVPFVWITLPSQSGLCPRESVGADRRLRRCSSLGGMTPAGAIDSQSKLQAAKRPTMTAYRYCASRDGLTPRSLLSPSESSMTRFNTL